MCGRRPHPQRRDATRPRHTQGRTHGVREDVVEDAGELQAAGVDQASVALAHRHGHLTTEDVGDVQSGGDVEQDGAGRGREAGRKGPGQLARMVP